MPPLFASVDSVMTIVAVVIAVIALPRVWWLTWGLWRHGTQPGARSADQSPEKVSERAELARVAPVACVAMTALLAILAVQWLFGHQAVGAKVAIGILGAAFFGGGALMFSVHYFRRPQWCIAPVMRDDRRPAAERERDAFERSYREADRELGKVSANLVRSFQEIEGAQRRGATSGAELAGRYEECAPSLRAAAQRFATLEAPATMREQLGELVEAIRAMADDLDRAAAAGRSADFPALEVHRGAVLEEMRRLDRALEAIDAALGRPTPSEWVAGERRPPSRV